MSSCEAISASRCWCLATSFCRMVSAWCCTDSVPSSLRSFDWGLLKIGALAKPLRIQASMTLLQAIAMHFQRSLLSIESLTPSLFSFVLLHECTLPSLQEMIG